ncbi:MAG TPA: hypothetical protein VFG05_11925 [Methylocella sp.]|nr:hypothetical protein [Methylocella sp.]
MTGKARPRAFSRRPLLLGLSLLAALAFDPLPAASQSFGFGPFWFHFGGHGHYGRSYRHRAPRRHHAAKAHAAHRPAARSPAKKSSSKPRSGGGGGGGDHGGGAGMAPL